MRRCSKCNALLDDKSVFCSFCGEKVTSTAVFEKRKDENDMYGVSRHKDSVCEKLHDMLQAARDAGEISERIYELKRQRDAVEAGQVHAMAVLFENINRFLSSENTKRFVDNAIVLSYGHLSRASVGNILLVDKKRPPLMSYTYADCQNVAAQARYYISNVLAAPNRERAFIQMCVGWNTLNDMISKKDMLLQDLRRNEFSKIDSEIHSLEAKIGEFSESDARNIVEKLEHTAGTMIIGSETVSVSDKNAGKSSISIPIVLEDSYGYGACMIEDDIGNAGRIIALLKGIFLRNCNRFKPNELQFAMIEDPNFCGKPLGCLANYFLKELCKSEQFSFASYLYGSVAWDKRKTDSILRQLKSTLDVRQTMRMSDGSEFCISAYNAENILNPLQYIVLLIGGYPNISMSSESYDLLCTIMRDGAQYGIFTIILGRDAQFLLPHEARPPLSERNKMLRIMKYDECTWFSFDSAKERETIDNVLATAKHSYLPLSELRKHIAEPTPVGVQVTVPVGLADGMIYDFATSTDKGKSVLGVGPHSIIVGATGSGKTEFVHTLILSTALSYSPDEVEFYIADFKNKEDATAYIGYIYRDGTDNSMYIPHVKFLANGNGAGRPREVLRMISSLHDKRSKLMREAGAQSFYDYHKSERIQELVRAGKLPPMPQIYFIIDEYNSVFNARDFSDTSNLCNDLQKCLDTVRTSGIGIILVGQRISISKESMSQIFNRVVFGMEQCSFNDMFKTNIFNPEVSTFSGRVGYAASVRSPDEKIAIVRMAYVNKQEKKQLVAEIRKKYGNHPVDQLMPGNETSVNANAYPGLGALPSQNEMNKQFCSSFPIGVSSLVGEPLSLDFGKQCYNFLICDTPEKQAWIELNLTLSFLYEHAKLGRRFAQPHVYFSYMPAGANIYIDTINQRGMSDEIIVDSKLPGIVKNILLMDDIYQDRWGRCQINGELNEDPIMFIFHNATWLDDIDAAMKMLNSQSMDKHSNMSREEKAHTIDAGEEEKKMLAAEFDEAGKLPGMANIPFELQETVLKNVMSYIDMPDDTSASTDKQKNLTKSKILEILDAVLRNGTKIGIYVVISWGDRKIIENSGAKRIDPYFRSIIEASGNKPNCCYLKQSELEVRLFNYTEADLWWRDFGRLRDNTLESSEGINGSNI